MDFPKHSRTDPLVLLLDEIENLQAQTRLMETGLKEAQLAADDKMARLEEQYEGELSGLRARIAELESAASALDHRAQGSAQGWRAARRLEELQSEPPQTSDRRALEEMTMKTGDSNEPLSGKAAELQEAGATQPDLERSLRNEIERLLHEAGEKNQILQDRNDELVRVKGELDRLQERLNQLESATNRTQSALAGDAERMHTEFQAQLALLQAELSQKEWALEDKQAAARGLEQKYRQEIEALRRQLAKHDIAISPDGGEFVAGEARPNQAQQERLEIVKDAEPHAGEVSLNQNRRRWHSGFGWKRRWRQ
jgi:chromosome segregation ATPase